MNLSKSKLRTVTSVCIVLAVYLLLAFALPFSRTGAFWLSVAFTVVAILAQLIFLRSAFDRGDPAKSKFYGFPIARVGVIYLAVQLVAGFVFMVLAAVAPDWLALIVFVFVFAAAALGLNAVEEVRDEIERQDSALKQDVSAMRALQSLSSSLPGQCADAAARAELEKLSESFRFSDPVSKPALAEIEAELSGMMDELQASVVDSDADAIRDLCRRVSARLAERNRLCRLNK